MKQTKTKRNRVYVEVKDELGVLFQNAREISEKRTGLRLNQHTLARNAVIIGLTRIVEYQEKTEA